MEPGSRIEKLKLDGELIRELLNEINEKLAEDDVYGEMYLVGGAAMILEYEAARATTDIDCVISDGADRIHQAAAEIAAERPGLPADWLNETAAAAHHVPEDPDDKATPSYQGSHLTVRTASVDRMLAMKLHARRGTDLKDIEQLVKFSKIGSGKEAKELAEQHFPHSEVPADAVRKVDDAITKARMQGPPCGPSARGAPTETAEAVAARMADELQERRETQGSRGLTESKGQPQTNQSTAAQDARSKAPKGQRPMRSGQDANIPAAPTRPEPPKTENSPGTRKRGR